MVKDGKLWLKTENHSQKRSITVKNNHLRSKTVNYGQNGQLQSKTVNYGPKWSIKVLKKKRKKKKSITVHYGRLRSKKVHYSQKQSITDKKLSITVKNCQ